MYRRYSVYIYIRRIFRGSYQVALRHESVVQGTGGKGPHFQNVINKHIGVVIVLETMYSPRIIYKQLIYLLTYFPRFTPLICNKNKISSFLIIKSS